jgi:hypothetical protein
MHSLSAVLGEQPQLFTTYFNFGPNPFNQHTGAPVKLSVAIREDYHSAVRLLSLSHGLSGQLGNGRNAHG